MTTTPLSTLDPYGHLTLREAFEKHYAENPQFFRPESFDNYYRKILTGHDIIHFLYGCDTSYKGESQVSLIEALKTNLNYGEYFRYVFSKQGWATTKKVYRDIGGFRIIPKFLPYLVSEFPKVWRATRSQRERLDYTAFNDNLDRTIKSIREEYGITPVS